MSFLHTIAVQQNCVETGFMDLSTAITCEHQHTRKRRREQIHPSRSSLFLKTPTHIRCFLAHYASKEACRGDCLVSTHLNERLAIRHGSHDWVQLHITLLFRQQRGHRSRSTSCRLVLLHTGMIFVHRCACSPLQARLGVSTPTTVRHFRLW